MHHRFGLLPVCIFTLFLPIVSMCSKEGTRTTCASDGGVNNHCDGNSDTDIHPDSATQGNTSSQTSEDGDTDMDRDSRGDKNTESDTAENTGTGADTHVHTESKISKDTDTYLDTDRDTDIDTGTGTSSYPEGDASPSNGTDTITASETAAIDEDDFHPIGYALFFSDEFDGDSLDRTKWCTRYIYGGGPDLQVPDPECTPEPGLGLLDYLNDEQQRYVDFNSQGETMHEVRFGVLKLRATKTRDDGDVGYALYESAMVRSKLELKPDATTSYYLTARLRLPDVGGTWPAFWLNSGRGTDGNLSWPPEIDIVEAPVNGVEDRNNMLHIAAMLTGDDHPQTGSGEREYTYTHPDFDTAWNNYIADRNLRDAWLEIGAHWTEDDVCFFVDGLKVACENYRWVYNDAGPANPAHMLINLAIGGSWAGRHGIDDHLFPTAVEVDHVRVYAGNP